MNFDQAFDTLMTFEGGYSNNPADSGGETKWGVTKKEAESNGYNEDMRLFTKDMAKQIYKSKYWDKIHIDNLPEGVRYAVFDAAVNSGPKQAVVWRKRKPNCQSKRRRTVSIKPARWLGYQGGWESEFGP